MVDQLIAVDAGGTSTRALIFDTTGLGLGFGRADGANPVTVGQSGATAAIVEAVQAARASQPETQSRYIRATIAMAGSSLYSQSDDLRCELESFGLSGPLEFCSDLAATYWSGAIESQGYAVVAGTGAGAIAISGSQVRRVVDGMGWLLGDKGSGIWCGQRVIQAVAASIDGAGPPTLMTEKVLEIADVTIGSPYLREDLIKSIYAMPPLMIAQFAPVLFSTSDDVVARQIIADASSELLHTVSITLDAEFPGPIVLGGGIMIRMAKLHEQIASLQQDIWGAPPDVRLVQDGIVGAAVCALRSHYAESDLPDSGKNIDVIFNRLRRYCQTGSNQIKA